MKKQTNKPTKKSMPSKKIDDIFGMGMMPEMPATKKKSGKSKPKTKKKSC